MESRIIKFYETTLRDGEQTPGVNYFPWARRLLRSHSGLSTPSLLSKPQRQAARLNRTNAISKMVIVAMMLSFSFMLMVR